MNAEYCYAELSYHLLELFHEEMTSRYKGQERAAEKL